MKFCLLKKLLTKSTLRKSEQFKGGKLQGAHNLFFRMFGPLKRSLKNIQENFIIKESNELLQKHFFPYFKIYKLKRDSEMAAKWSLCFKNVPIIMFRCLPGSQREKNDFQHTLISIHTL